MGIILALIFGLARAAHGGGYVGRSVSVLIMAFSYAAYLLVMGSDWIYAGICGVVVGVFSYLGLVLGWGAYFSSFTGNIESTKEDEVKLADWFGDMFEPVVETAADARRWGIAGMCARFCAFIPLFIAASWCSDNLWVLLKGSVSIAASGFIYGALRYNSTLVEKYGTRAAEFVTFAIIGWALV